MSCKGGPCIPDIATLEIYAIDQDFDEKTMDCKGSMTLIAHCIYCSDEIYNVFDINGVNWGSTAESEETPCQIDGCDEFASFIASFNDPTKFSFEVELCYDHRKDRLP